MWKVHPPSIKRKFLNILNISRRDCSYRIYYHLKGTQSIFGEPQVELYEILFFLPYITQKVLKSFFISQVLSLIFDRGMTEKA